MLVCKQRHGYLGRRQKEASPAHVYSRDGCAVKTTISTNNITSNFLNIFLLIIFDHDDKNI